MALFLIRFKFRAIILYNIYKMDKTYHYSYKNLFRKFFPKNAWTAFPFVVSILLTLGVMLLYYFLAPNKLYKDGYNLLFNMPLYFSIMILPVNFIWIGIKVNYIRYHSYNNFTRKDLFIVSAIISAIWSFVSFALIIVMLMCILNKNIFMLNSILYGQLIYSFIMFVMSTYALAMMFAIIIKSNKALGLFFVTITIYSLIVSGQIIPYSLFGKNGYILSYFALASPLNYSMSLINNTLMISDYTSALKINPDYLSSAGYTKYLNRIGANIFDFKNGFVFQKNPPSTRPTDYLVYSTWNKAFNLAIPYLIVVMGVGVANSFYYYMVLPKSLVNLFKIEQPAYNAPIPGNNDALLNSEQPINNEAMYQEQPVVDEEAMMYPYTETHEANVPWEEDGNYYYHDGQGNYYQADPTGTQWISIPPRV